MFYKIFADIIVFIHFFWIVFLFLGAVWGVKNKVIRVIHLSGIFFAITIQVFDWFCPLTHLEFWLRSKHDSTLSYAGSFITYYVEKVVYLELSRAIILLLTIFLSGFNAWFYLRRGKYLRHN